MSHATQTSAPSRTGSGWGAQFLRDARLLGRRRSMPTHGPWVCVGDAQMATEGTASRKGSVVKAMMPDRPGEGAQASARVRRQVRLRIVRRKG